MHLYRRTKPTPRDLGEIVLTANHRPPDAAVDVEVASCLFPAATVELKLYSREWCSWCIDAKDYLSEKGYRFREIDVGKDRQAYEEMKQLSAQTYVPTFVAGDKVLANFDTNQLEKFLSKHQINP